MLWDKDSLLSKAKLYIQRAFDRERRDGELFPFWATIGLEFLGRAVLASVHPSLLADPQTPEAVLYACGIGERSTAKSVHAKTVFARCQLIVMGFTKGDFAYCMSLMSRRNEELHTGAAAFEGFTTEAWLAEYYRVTAKLLSHLGFGLADVLTLEDATAADEMILAAARELEGQTKRQIADHRAIFTGLTPDQLVERRGESLTHARWFPGPKKMVKCPACDENCLTSGHVIRSTDAILVKDELYWESIVLPNLLRCHVCGLELKGHEALHVAGVGGQFSVARVRDAAEYYLEGVDPSQFFEEEYHNS